VGEVYPGVYRGVLYPGVYYAYIPRVYYAHHGRLEYPPWEARVPTMGGWYTPKDHGRLVYT